MIPLLKEMPNKAGGTYPACNSGMMLVREEDSHLSKYLGVAEQYLNPFSTKQTRDRKISGVSRVSKMSETVTSEFMKSEVPVIERLQEAMQKDDPLLKN